MMFAVRRSTEVPQTARDKQALGLFDLPPSLKSKQAWDVELELQAAWNVGVIIGPSGRAR